MEHIDIYRQMTLPHYQRPKKEAHAVPKNIGPYTVDALLHEGSMSLLYLGAHPELKKPIAIKILSPSLIKHPELVDQFLEESKIISLADHPNIVKLYAEGKWENGLYIAMEFIQGISLRQFITNKSLSLKRAVDLLLQTSYALLHLHTHGVIHRDLKPENILITENGKIKVIDFGIAQLQDANTNKPSLPGALIGTPSYMSPEQKKNPGKVSFNTDIYSLGVIAYELILGKFSFGNLQLDLIPKHIRPILQKALAPSPEDRYQDIVDIITDLSKYLKTNEIEKDLSHEDELLDIWESLDAGYQKLLPKDLPHWPDLEINLAKPQNVCLFGVYYDFFRLPDGSFVVILAESPSSHPSSIAPISTLRGIVRATLHDYISSEAKSPFSSGSFALKLNRIFSSEPHNMNEAITILHLSPYLNQFSFISSGFETLWHLSGSRGSRPRILHNQSPMLGHDPTSTFFSTNDTWDPGDLIVLHSFGSGPLPLSQRHSIESLSTKWIEENKHLSPDKLSSALLSYLQSTLTMIPNTTQKVALSLLRLS